MITTIQIHQKIKAELDIIKKDKETYEDVILRLVELEEKQKRNNKELLIEGCKEMYEDSLRINKEWKVVDSELDWEW